MSYASVGGDEDCKPSEVWNYDFDRCETLICDDPDEVAYYGECIGPEEQREVLEDYCWPTEVIDMESKGCRCKPGLVRAADMSCVPAGSATTAPATQALAVRQQAGVGAAPEWLLGLAVVGAVSAAAYWYFR